jgi:isoaspartyl peptidase/L-asparaginase-like protein (Ntn-hydrolase superfamily)
MSAAIMDGETQKLSGVINIQDVKNPVFVAKELMKKTTGFWEEAEQKLCYRTWFREFFN